MAEPLGLRYTKTHEWVMLENEIAKIGITDHAQEELGDVALVQLPEVGRVLQADEMFGEIESIKAVSELFAPISGEVTETNPALEASPELVNNDPYGRGWMLKLRVKNLADVDSLLNAASYLVYLEEV